MEITFLGTGTSGGVPMIACQCRVCKSTDPRDKRLRSSILIKTKGLTLAIDCGPDFRQQMLREDVLDLNGILMTHAHKDHTGGIDDIRSFNFMNNKAIEIYCDRATETGIREQYSYVFAESDYPYLPRINFIRIEEAPFRIGDLEIVPFEVMHAQLPVKGYRFGDFAYITDAKTVSEKERKKIRGTKVLVVNALRLKEHYSHFTIDEAIAFANDMGAEQTFLIHMSHHFGLHAEVEKTLPANVKPAYDGLKINI